MNLITFVENKHELYLCKELGLSEVILSHKDFSRFGKLDTKMFLELAAEAKAIGIEPIFEWDILMVEKDFTKIKALFESLDLTLFNKIRVQDPGALNYIFVNYPDKKIELNLEVGNHNLVAIKTWVSFFKERLSKVILSIELPHATLSHFIENIPCDVEILGLGRILLFYTPRNLLSNLLPEDDDLKKKELFDSRFIEASGESEESPHKGFPIVENKHGTFMFHIKEHYLLDHMEEVNNLGLKDLRVDLRFGKDFNLLKEIKNIVSGHITDTKAFKGNYPSDLIRGFFHVNKTDVLFKKLKNSRIARHDENYIGEIIDVNKGEFLGIYLSEKHKALEVGSKLKFTGPQGKDIEAPIKFLKDLSQNDIENSMGKNLVLINYVSGVWVKSQVYSL